MQLIESLVKDTLKSMNYVNEVTERPSLMLDRILLTSAGKTITVSKGMQVKVDGDTLVDCYGLPSHEIIACYGAATHGCYLILKDLITHNQIKLPL